MNSAFRFPSGPTGGNVIIQNDNMSQFAKYDLPGQVQPLPIVKTSVDFNFGNLYATKSQAKTATTDEDSNTGTTYPIKISPTNDSSHTRLVEGDICYSYKTDEDQKLGNDVYTVYSLPQINKRALIYAAKVAAALKTDFLPKRARTDSVTDASNGINKYLKIFPLSSTEFMENWKKSGVFSWTKNKPIPDSHYRDGLRDVNYSNLFKACSMVIWSTTNIATLIAEPVIPTDKIYIRGSNVIKTFESVYDNKGRKIASMQTLPGFQLRLVKTPDGAHPGFMDCTREVEATREIIFPLSDPATGAKIQYERPPPVGIRMTEVESPYIEPFGIVREVNGSIPTRMEVERALIDEDRHLKLLADSKLKVHLFCQGWGPYNCYM